MLLLPRTSSRSISPPNIKKHTHSQHGRQAIMVHSDILVQACEKGGWLRKIYLTFSECRLLLIKFFHLPSFTCVLTTSLSLTRHADAHKTTLSTPCCFSSSITRISVKSTLILLCPHLAVYYSTRNTMGSTGYYPYDPTSTGTILAMLSFGGSAIAHLWQMSRLRTWFITAFLIGAFSIDQAVSPPNVTEE